MDGFGVNSQPRPTVLSKVVAEHLETFLGSFDTDPNTKGLPACV